MSKKLTILERIRRARVRSGLLVAENDIPIKSIISALDMDKVPNGPIKYSRFKKFLYADENLVRQMEKWLVERGILKHYDQYESSDKEKAFSLGDVSVPAPVAERVPLQVEKRVPLQVEECVPLQVEKRVPLPVAEDIPGQSPTRWCCFCGEHTAGHRINVRFCKSCGAPFDPQCPKCGVENSQSSIICVGCGEKLTHSPQMRLREEDMVADEKDRTTDI